MDKTATQSEDQPAWMHKLEKMRPSAVLGELEDRIGRWKTEVADLEERASARSAKAKQALDTQITEIRGEMDEIEARMDELREAGEEEAERIKGRLTALAIGVRRDLDRAKKRIEGGD